MDQSGEDDLYNDVRPCLTRLRSAGLWLGITSNQTVRSGRVLRDLFTDDVDLIGTSDDWGAERPDLVFFERVANAAAFHVGEILYVGDQCDNDLPALDASMRTALVRRGPWATIQQNSVAAHCTT